MKRISFASSSAVGRVFTVVAVTVFIGLIANVLLYEGANRFSLREEEARRASEHIVIVARLLEGESPERRERIVDHTSTEHFKLDWYEWPIATAGGAIEMYQMRYQMMLWEPSLRDMDLRVYLASPQDTTEVVGSLQLRDGSWLHFRAQDLIGAWQLKRGQILFACLPILGIVFIAMTALRRILQPLRRLAHAVSRVGQGESVVLPEEGPGDFRHLIRAYNEMQARIATMIRERTEALAAVGHDLRTPLARLRLNADSVSDSHTRTTVMHDLDEMEQMLDSLLTYFRGDDHSEKLRLVDLAVLVATVVDDLQDRGFDITYDGPPHCDYKLRLIEFKRALINLTNNACQYGTHATVQLLVEKTSVRICVEDDGPGVPEEDLLRIRNPFQRLDIARRRNTSGVGLGLPIAIRVVADAGGQLRLSNRTVGGFCAEIELPVSDSAML